MTPPLLLLVAALLLLAPPTPRPPVKRVALLVAIAAALAIVAMHSPPIATVETPADMMPACEPHGMLQATIDDRLASAAEDWE